MSAASPCRRTPSAGWGARIRSARRAAIVAGEAIDTIASATGLTLFTAAGGRLCRLPGDGSVEEVETEGVVTALYPRGQVLVLEYANGTAQYWAADMSAPAPLEQY